VRRQCMLRCENGRRGGLRKHNPGHQQVDQAMVAARIHGGGAVPISLSAVPSA
jgi:hypothetical protein